MGRKPRIYIKGGLYFVTTQGDHRERLFRDDEDGNAYLELLAKYKEQYGFKLFAFVLMPEFVHLLIEPAGDVTISEIMHVMNSRYTQYFNGRYDRRGSLFQSRFNATLVEKAAYFLEIIRYIHLVPVLMKLEDKPEQYKWSSCPTYEGIEEDRVGIGADTKEALLRFSPEPDGQTQMYREFMGEAQKADLQQLKKKLEQSWMLGSKEFIKNIKEQLKREERREEIKERSPKVLIIGGTVAVLALLVFIFYLYKTNVGLTGKFEDTIQEREDEFVEQLVTQKQKIKESLDEKYRADKVSYKAMSKRLEKEKERTKEIEETLKQIQEGSSTGNQ